MSTQFAAGDLTGTLDSGVSMAANTPGSALDVAAFEWIMFEVDWAGLDHADGSFDIEVSMDGVTNWGKYPGSNAVVTVSPGFQQWVINELSAIPFIRVFYNHGTATTGTFSTVFRREVPA